MRIVSYKTGAGRRAREKVHTVDNHSIAVGHHRDGLTGKCLPGRTLVVEFDGRTHILELSEKEAAHVVEFLGRKTAW